jgi:hypothetical protein
MKDLIKPRYNTWVGTNDDQLMRDGALMSRLSSVEVWFCDLDDNHAKSPAKYFARNAVGTSYFSKDFICWCSRTGIDLARRGKSAHSDTWREYIDLFLRSDKALEEVERIFNPKTAGNYLYPGVKSFCSITRDSGAKRHYVTRNIAEVAKSFARYLSFDGYRAEAFEKGEVVKEFIARFPQFQSFGVDGDSDEDGDMIDTLRSAGKDVFSVYTMKERKEKLADSRFDVFTSKSRLGLVGALLN